MKNWFRKKVERPDFIVGGTYREYEGLDYGKISFVVSVVCVLIIVIYLFIK